MHLKYRNVNDAFRGMVGGIHDGSIPVRRSSSRVGDVIVIDDSVIVTYTHPRERVLMNPSRDLNCFFALYEALWTIVGRDDVAPLAWYNGRVHEFSDDGRTFSGGYGRRWRHAQTTLGDDSIGPDNFECDQLNLLVEHLKSKPDSRRAVLSMWDVEDDLLKVDTSRDVCCNLSACFSLRDAAEMTDTGGFTQCDEPISEPATTGVLDLTVFNRSNDLAWGLLGNDQVLFSVLLEYMAGRLGVGVGRYHQVTANAHAYLSTWRPDEWLRWRESDDGLLQDHFPLVQDPAAFDAELPEFVSHHASAPASDRVWSEPFLAHVAGPMMDAFHCYKRGDLAAALATIDGGGDPRRGVWAADWQAAARGWIERRIERRRARG